MKKRSWGFDVRELDHKIRPQDDFYHHANGIWMKNNPIPKEESRWGSFVILRVDTEKKLRTIVEEVSKKRSAPGTPARMVRDLYASGMDSAGRTTAGLRPLLPYLKRIDELQTYGDLERLLPDLHMIGVGVLFGAAVDQDSKDSTKYILHLYQDGLGLPDREYYLSDSAEQKRVRDAYLPHVEAIFKLMGKKSVEAQHAAQTVVAIETKLARASMKKEDRRDAEKTYHKKKVTELAKLAPQISWTEYLAAIGTNPRIPVIVMQPAFFKTMAALTRTIPIESWKDYLRFHLINDYAAYLGTRFVNQDFEFYGKTLAGAKVIKPTWRRTLAVVNGVLSELLGQLYVEKHFPKHAKKLMNELVDDLFAAYEERLRHIEWMSPKTRVYALKKLNALTRKIGYPEKWKSYKGLLIKPNDYCGNVIRSSQYEHRREMKKLGKPIDRDEWFMAPQAVNAYFAPNMNDIAFPAAILQPPFFSPDADPALNYGAIGAVIGHEITHGFDDQGSKYDAKGNLKNWWTKEDRARFEAKAKLVKEQYDRFTVADGVHVNGKLTLGENIADFGGLTIAYAALQRRLEKTGRTIIDGLTPEQRFFLGFSVFERENCRPEFEKMAVLTDPHSPGIYRINGPLSNFSAFYDAYSVKKGDKLYRDEKVRARIW